MRARRVVRVWVFCSVFSASSGDEVEVLPLSLLAAATTRFSS